MDKHVCATDDGWLRLARCAEEDPELFFPPQGGSAQPAKRLCRMCQVRAQCLLEALEHGEIYGIWGGTSEEERRALRRSIRRSAPPARSTSERVSA